MRYSYKRIAVTAKPKCKRIPDTRNAEKLKLETLQEGDVVTKIMRSALYTTSPELLQRRFGDGFYKSCAGRYSYGNNLNYNYKRDGADSSYDKEVFEVIDIDDNYVLLMMLNWCRPIFIIDKHGIIDFAKRGAYTIHK